MSNFKSIIVPDEIIIIENKKGQGYIVNPDNKEMLDRALSWANGWGKDFTPITHNCKNGQFKLSLKDCADQSYNGGKLSFWNCNVVCPDGAELLIGINQETLCLLLKACTSINGNIQENIYLGTYNGNGAAFTENQPEYIQAKDQAKLRNKEVKKTSKYIPGDIVGTIKNRYIYLGEFRHFYNIFENYYYASKHYDSRTYHITTNDNEYTAHVYLDIDNNNIVDYYLNDYNINHKKTPYFIFDHLSDIDTQQLFKTMLKHKDYSSLRKLQFNKNLSDVKDKIKTYHNDHRSNGSEYLIMIDGIADNS